MFRIGQFSTFTRVSVRMLRHYDELGLLTPAQIDQQTGYRYYTADQLPRLNRIIALRELGFSLEQIGELLNENLTPDEIRGMLRLRQAEIRQQLDAEQIRLSQVEDRLRHIEQEKQLSQYEVVLRHLPQQLVASLRQVVPSFGDPITAIFDELEIYVTQHGGRANQSPLTIFHDDDYRETDLDVEVVVPLEKRIPENDRIKVADLAETPHMACVIFTGEYSKMTAVLNYLLTWIANNHYEIAGPLREVYLRFGAGLDERIEIEEAFLTNSNQLYVTEIQIPVKKKE